MSPEFSSSNESWEWEKELENYSAARWRAPMYLWTNLIQRCALEAERTMEDEPVPTAEDVEDLVMPPMSWYYQSLEEQGCAPDMQALDPMANVPTFEADSQAMSGVVAAVEQSDSSTRWLDAVCAVTYAIELGCKFLGTIADRNCEAYDMMMSQIFRLRIYMDSVARHADIDTSIKALAMVGDVVCSRAMILYPNLMVEMLACSLSFANWEDTRAVAYSALNRAMTYMRSVARYCDIFGSDSPLASYDTVSWMDQRPLEAERIEALLDYVQQTSEAQEFSPQETQERMALVMSWILFEQRVAYLRHDMYQLCGDYEAADAMELAEEA